MTYIPPDKEEITLWMPYPEYVALKQAIDEYEEKFLQYTFNTLWNGNNPYKEREDKEDEEHKLY